MTHLSTLKTATAPSPRLPRLIPVLLLAALLLAPLPLTPAPANAGGGLLAGVGRGEITPPVGTAQWGYGNRSCVLNPGDCIEQRLGRPGDTEGYGTAFRSSEGIHQRLWARAVILQDPEGDRVAMVQADMGASSAALKAAVLEQLQDHGITAAELLIAPTHTHAGPGALHGDPFHFVGFGDAYDPRVVDVVASGIARAVSRALGSMQPAVAAIGRVEIPGATRNRAMEAYERNADLDPSLPPVNRTATMLRVDAADGVPLGLFSTFANHGTVQGDDQLLFSGDNAGYAARLLEAVMSEGLSAGVTRPVAAWANGEEGDVAPTAEGSDAFDRSQDNGQRQAGPAAALWSALGEQLRGDLDVAVALDVRAMADGAADGHDMSRTPIYGLGGSCLPTDLPGIGAKCPMAPSGPPPTHMPFHAIRVEDTVWLGLPFEVTTQAGRRIRASAADVLAEDPTIQHIAIAGLANDYGGYLTTPEEYELQRYEGQMTWWGPDQQRFIAEAAAQVSGLLLDGRQGAPSPPSAPPALADEPIAADTAATLRTRAGTVIAEPDALPLAFSWAGGHPGVDLPHEQTQVHVQRLHPDGSWQTIATDGDGDILITLADRADADVWTARWRAATPPAGTYRVHVTGRWTTAAGTPTPYEVTSRPIHVGPGR